VYTDANPLDGWGYVWFIDSFSDTVTPSIDLRAMAHDGAGRAVESGVTALGLNRTPPTGTLRLSPLVSSTEVTTLTVPLVWAATDPSPDRGPIRISLGNGDWILEDSAMSWTFGQLVPDAGAGDGSAWLIGADTVGTLSGGDGGRLIPGQAYRAYVRLKAPAQALTSFAELARLAALADRGSDVELLGVRYIRGTDLKAGEAYQEFALDIPGVPDEGTLEWRVDAFGRSKLWVDRISLAHYPVTSAPAVTWTLSPREGPATISARFQDGAGNVSSPVSLGVTVTDHSPPGQWRRFLCGVLTCTVQVRDAIAGLDTGSAEMRLSEDGGASWGDWLPVSCSGEDSSHEWETLTASVVDVPAEDSMEQIEFRVYDRAQRPNQGRSPTYLRIQVYLPIILRSAS
jgi:hypothetical protein